MIEEEGAYFLLTFEQLNHPRDPKRAPDIWQEYLVTDG
jgi:hypothetical protein